MTDMNITLVNCSTYRTDCQMEQEMYERSDWYGKLLENQAEELLLKQPPNTYLLRGTDDPEKFYLSFVGSHLKIQHQYFMMDRGRKEWFYENGDTNRVISLKLLIPKIMHCFPHECIPLKRDEPRL